MTDRPGHFTGDDIDMVRVHAAMTEAGRKNEAERLERIRVRNAEHVAAGGRICGSMDQHHGGPCTRPAIHVYLPGPRCPMHTPARFAGRPENVPDPARTMAGIRAAWYADRDETPVPMTTPVGSTLIDQRAIASGKRRSTPETYKAARAAESARKR